MKALAAGKQIQYVGVLGQAIFDASHNSGGQFSANKFSADGSATQVGTMPGPEVLALLG